MMEEVIAKAQAVLKEEAEKKKEREVRRLKLNADKKRQKISSREPSHNKRAKDALHDYEIVAKYLDLCKTCKSQHWNSCENCIIPDHLKQFRARIRGHIRVG